MKTLLQINVVVNSGSTGRIAEEIGQIAINNGWNSYIAYGRNIRQSKSELIRIGTDLDVKLHGLKTRFLDLHGFGSGNATKKLVEQIKQINPDIIHLHNIHGYYLNIEILFNYLATTNIPVIWTLHDCWPFTGHCSHFEYVGCEKWKSQCFSCPQKKEYPKSLFLDNSKQNFIRKQKLFNSIKNLTIVAVSDWLNKLLKDSMLKMLPTKVIKNGIDIETFKPSTDSGLRIKLGLQNKFIILGVASTWTAKKGFNDFILLSQLLSDDFRIILIGLSQKQLKQLPSKMTGIERTENTEQLAKYYSMADLYANLTYEDTFPTTNLEALACGTPVLTYNTGGCAETVTQETGFLIEKNRLNTIIQCVEILRSKEKIIKTETCRNFAERFLNKNNIYIRYFELYIEILANRYY